MFWGSAKDVVRWKPETSSPPRLSRANTRCYNKYLALILMWLSWRLLNIVLEARKTGLSITPLPSSMGAHCSWARNKELIPFSSSPSQYPTPACFPSFPSHFGQPLIISCPDFIIAFCGNSSPLGPDSVIMGSAILNILGFSTNMDLLHKWTLCSIMYQHIGV